MLHPLAALLRLHVAVLQGRAPAMTNGLDKPKRKRKNPHAVALGRLGGRVKSAAKTKAVQENGKKGGRPKKGRDA